ncbi:hypothetical protein ACIQM4_23355 [Streptomyces sp. NPDC091272]|uniref:hypothetical protein n=1 Tax=Streptomyces sp. NPDC091272 TaxID=3365981 RepID=UPI0037F28F35
MSRNIVPGRRIAWIVPRRRIAWAVHGRRIVWAVHGRRIAWIVHGRRKRLAGFRPCGRQRGTVLLSAPGATVDSAG